jgi:hypothetical protein
MFNLPSRSLDRNAKLSSSAVPELQRRLNSDLPQPVKFPVPVPQNENCHDQSLATSKFPSVTTKEQPAASKDVCSILQENIEMIKNLKDEMTVE